MKKIAVILLVLCMVCLLPGTAFGADTSDIENHWGKKAIQNWMDKGLIGGYPDGTFRPDKAVTRAEFMSMVNQAFNLEPEGSISFTDVAETAWYYDVVRAAAHAGYIGGYPDGSIKPNRPLYRQEAAVILAKIKNTPQNPEAIHQFSDADKIAGWARGYVGAVAAEGYMSGYPMGTFKPISNITRAEAVTMLYKAQAVQATNLEVVYHVEGVYGPETGKATIAKDVAIKSGGVILQNLVIKGSLIIAEEVGDGDVTLNNIAVEGETFIRGGGKDSIHINGGNYNKITVQKTSEGNVRIVATNLQGVEFIVSEAAAGEEIIIEGNFDRIAIEADNAKVTTQGETKIKEFIVGEGARNAIVRFSDHTIVSRFVADAKTVVQGQGIIEVATGKMVASSAFEKEPVRIIKPGGSNKTVIEAVTITGEAIVGTMLTAVPSPAAATVDFQWKISSDGGTYTHISGAAASTYMPVNDDVGKFIKAEARGTGGYKGVITSDAAGPVIPARAQTASASASALTAAAGEDTEVTLVVLDGLGGIDTSFSGERTVNVSGAVPSPLGSYGSFNGTELTLASESGQAVAIAFTSGAAIANLSLHKASAQTIAFSIAGVAAPAADPISLTIVPASAAGMYLSADIAAPEISGGLFDRQPVITLKDPYGNVCVNDNNTSVTAARKDGGAWTLTGIKTVTAASGVVSFSDLGAENIVETSGVQIAFTAGSLPEVLSAAVTLPFHALTATAAASSATPAAGDANPVTLTVKDALDNTAARYNGVWTVTVSGVAPSPFGSYGSFNGTELTADSTTGQDINVTFTSGVAIVDLSLSKAAAQTISFSIADVAAPAANPITFTPAPGSADGIYITTNIAAPAINGGVFSQQPAMTLKDAFGNLCANDSFTAVTATKKDGGAWTLTGTKTATASSGTVSFTDLGATNAAEISGAQIAFKTGSLPEELSAAVTLPFYAQTATADVTTSFPVAGAANSVTLTVKDALGNLDTTFNGTRAVTISGVDPALLGSYGAFNGTALNSSSKTGQNINVTFTNGVATPDLCLHKAAAQTIAFRVAGVAIPGTNAISIAPVVSEDVSEGKIVVTDPGLQGSGIPFPLEITLYDQYGNTVKNGTHAVTVNSSPGGVLVNEELTTFNAGSGAVAVMLSGDTNHTLTVSVSSAAFTSAAPGTVLVPVWNDASGWFILGDASGGGGGGGERSKNGARGGNGGGDDDTINGTDGNDVIFGDGSGGGGGYPGASGSVRGAAGSGGGGNDIICGGLGNDIIFGDGFNGATGWNSNRGGFGGGGGGGGGGNLAGNIGGQGGLGAGSGRGYAGNGSILVPGFGNSGNSVATAKSTIGNGGSNGGYWDSGFGGGGGFGGSNGGAGGNSSSAAAPGRDGNTNPHAYKFSGSTVSDYISGRLENILASYPNYGAGNDVIDGGRGSDQLFGLGGNDTFEFRLDGTYGNEDVDTIWDFNLKGADRIRLLNSGVEITPESYAEIVAAQTADGKDRTIVFSNGSGQQVTIIVKNLNRDLTDVDFGL